MNNLDDFFLFQMCTEEEENSGGSGDNSGCLSWFLGACVVLWILSKLA